MKPRKSKIEHPRFCKAIKNLTNILSFYYVTHFKILGLGLLKNNNRLVYPPAGISTAPLIFINKFPFKFFSFIFILYINCIFTFCRFIISIYFFVFNIINCYKPSSINILDGFSLIYFSIMQ